MLRIQVKKRLKKMKRKSSRRQLSWGLRGEKMGKLRENLKNKQEGG